MPNTCLTIALIPIGNVLFFANFKRKSPYHGYLI